MNVGRPPAWNPFREISPESWTEPAAVKERGRLTIPSEIRRRVDWLSSLPASLLAGVGLDGSAELMPWETFGEGLIDAQMKRLQSVEEPVRGRMAVALSDKFYRLTIEEPGRLVLPSGLRSFLGAFESTPVRVVATHQQIWLWNERRWQDARADREAILG